MKDTTTITTRSLLCDLTASERHDYGIKLAATLGDIVSVKDEKKKDADHYKDRIAGLQASADEISRKVRDGKEWREVECQIVLSSPDPQHKQTIRMDTGEIISTDRMTSSDLQLVMPLGESATDDHDDAIEVGGEVVYQEQPNEEMEESGRAAYRNGALRTHAPEFICADEAVAWYRGFDDEHVGSIATNLLEQALKQPIKGLGKWIEQTAADDELSAWPRAAMMLHANPELAGKKAKHAALILDSVGMGGGAGPVDAESEEAEETEPAQEQSEPEGDPGY